MAAKKWTDEERYAALKLYFELEFGQFHSKNPSVIQLAELLGRTPGSIAMKLGNFASLDPTLDRKGFTNVSAADRALMVRFHNQPQRVVDEMERAADHLEYHAAQQTSSVEVDHDRPGLMDSASTFDISGRPTIVRRERNERLNQGFFRRAVISGYRFQCCVCRLTMIRMLEAAHIKPHKDDETCRLRPDNGLSLCRNHHKAFDEGYWTLNSQFQIELDPRIHRLATRDQAIGDMLVAFDGKKIHQPFRYLPSADFIEWHRENTFASKEIEIGKNGMF